ncbi:hypothetical protein VNO78_10734 [Psophocarpus tetragonolobus]|uniref:Uncharacterized protein n=1 Tax=Psophocarpus tetragonolobus TaxID=3891 RepID=A0AAN9XN08_PSOTE
MKEDVLCMRPFVKWLSFMYNDEACEHDKMYMTRRTIAKFLVIMSHDWGYGRKTLARGLSCVIRFPLFEQLFGIYTAILLVASFRYKRCVMSSLHHFKCPRHWFDPGVASPLSWSVSRETTRVIGARHHVPFAFFVEIIFISTNFYFHSH